MSGSLPKLRRPCQGRKPPSERIRISNHEHSQVCFPRQRHHCRRVLRSREVFRISAPGTILTFFPWVDATVGQRGVGQANQTAFRVPLRSIDYWINRFIQRGISHQTQERRFGETVLSFADQDGMALALVGIADAENEPGWSNGDIPPNMRSAVFRASPCCSTTRNLLPRTRRRAVRDRDRYSRICRRRTGRSSWSALEVARVSRIASQGDRGPATRPRDGGNEIDAIV